MIAAGTVLLLGAGTSHAAIDKCQKRIQGEGAKLQKFIYSALQKCADAIRKEKAAAVVKGGDDCSPGKACLANAAAFCEKQLATVYDAANVKPFKSKFELFRAALEKSSAANECTDSDLRLLEGMGHQLSGSVSLATAPPASGTCDFNSDGKADTNCRLKFLTDWLMFAIEDAAIKQLMAQTPDLMAILKDAVEATSADPAKPSTECSNTSDPGYRPNLCRFGVQCFNAVCSLDSSSSNANLDVPALFPINIPLEGTLPTAVCRPGGTTTTQQGLGAEFGVNPNTLYLINSAGRTIQKEFPSEILGFIKAICVDVLTSQGWCDCSGQGVKVDATVCQDRVGRCDASTNSSCLPGSGTVDECGVADTLSDPFIADSLFPNSNEHSERTSISIAGSSTAGDCVDFVTMQFKVLRASEYGPDGVPCTDDDGAGPLAAITGPLTTGSVTVELKDAIQSAGTCASTENCITNADCATPPCDTSTLQITDASATVTGAKPTNACANYTAGKLSGLKLVTGLALADLAIGAPLNTSLDGLLTVELVCQ